MKKRVKEGLGMGFLFEGKRLDEIQNYLDAQMNQVERICDIPITKEDYLYLEQKIQQIMKAPERSLLLVEYKPSVVVYWVFTLIYAEDDTKKVTAFFNQLPQYLQRSYLYLCLDVFGEHGFMKYRESTYNIRKEVRTLLTIQAGFPEELVEQWD